MRKERKKINKTERGPSRRKKKDKTKKMSEERKVMAS